MILLRRYTGYNYIMLAFITKNNNKKRVDFSYNKIEWFIK